MTPARKTSAILTAAAAAAAASTLLTLASPATTAKDKDAPARHQPTAPLEVRARLESTHLPVGTSEVFMAVTLRADELVNAPRPALNLAIVLDRSGSMAGAKLEHAKAAARQLTTRMRPIDRVAIVAYGSEVAVPFSSQLATDHGKAQALTAIDAIYDDGGTNLSGGLLAGRDQLRPHQTADAVSRIVLISDGMANAGISDPHGLAELGQATAREGISISTIGVGLDFDERTMTDIAVAGAGHYYFAESSLQLAHVFDQELARVRATVATDVELAILPAAGVEIVDALGYELVRRPDGAQIAVADIHGGETRKVIVQLQVTAQRAGGIDLANMSVRYREVDRGVVRQQEFKSRAEATANAQLILDGRDPATLRHVEKARTGAAINRATALYERGDYQGAHQLLKSRAETVKTLAAELDDGALEALSRESDEAVMRMQAAPNAAGSAGAKAKKANRKGAYDLMY
jgi:Ca-activated chloride channel homolog